MADQTGDAPNERAAWNAHIIFGSIAFGLCSVLIAFLVWKGSPTNSLHESALTAAFWIIAAILAGFGVGSSLTPILDAWKPK